LNLITFHALRVILLADDDEDDRMFFETAFSFIISNLELETVASGQQVLQYLEAYPGRLPSLIILDYNMPRLNGPDVIRAVYKHPNYLNIPIVIFSTSASDYVVKECLKEGAIKCFVKPSNMQQLISTTKEILKFVVDEDL
jgi:CheY-like chemotaxis protein